MLSLIKIRSKYLKINKCGVFLSYCLLPLISIISLFYLCFIADKKGIFYFFENKFEIISSKKTLELNLMNFGNI